MPVCSFCRKRYKEPRGLTVFTFDGRSVFYCSSKCRRNHALGRDPKKTNWVRKREGFLEGAGGEAISEAPAVAEAENSEKKEKPEKK